MLFFSMDIYSQVPFYMNSSTAAYNILVNNVRNNCTIYGSTYPYNVPFFLGTAATADVTYKANQGTFNIYRGMSDTFIIRDTTDSINGLNVLGNLGVGTRTPLYRLDVNGDVNVSSGSRFLINGVPLSSTGDSDLLAYTTTQVAAINADLQATKNSTNNSTNTIRSDLISEISSRTAQDNLFLLNLDTTTQKLTITILQLNTTAQELTIIKLQLATTAQQLTELYNFYISTTADIYGKIHLAQLQLNATSQELSRFETSVGIASTTLGQNIQLIGNATHYIQFNFLPLTGGVIVGTVTVDNLIATNIYGMNLWISSIGYVINKSTIQYVDYLYPHLNNYISMMSDVHGSNAYFTNVQQSTADIKGIVDNLVTAVRISSDTQLLMLGTTGARETWFETVVSTTYTNKQDLEDFQRTINSDYWRTDGTSSMTGDWDISESTISLGTNMNFATGDFTGWTDNGTDWNMMVDNGAIIYGTSGSNLGSHYNNNDLIMIDGAGDKQAIIRVIGASFMGDVVGWEWVERGSGYSIGTDVTTTSTGTGTGFLFNISEVSSAAPYAYSIASMDESSKLIQNDIIPEVGKEYKIEITGSDTSGGIGSFFVYFGGVPLGGGNVDLSGGFSVNYIVAVSTDKLQMSQTFRNDRLTVSNINIVRTYAITTTDLSVKNIFATNNVMSSVYSFKGDTNSYITNDGMGYGIQIGDEEGSALTVSAKYGSAFWRNMTMLYSSIYFIGIFGSPAMHIQDDQRIYMGSSDNSSIRYSGSNMIVNPQESGEGNFVVSQGSISINSGSIIMYDTVFSTQGYHIQITNGELKIIKQ